MTAGPLLLLALQAVPFSEAATSLLELAEEAPIAVLVERSRNEPLLFREALSLAFARSIGADRSGGSLDAAKRMVDAHAAAWTDEFLVEQLERFIASSPASRREKVVADSLRRAGAEALSTEGFNAAAPLWRTSAARARAIDDTAGLAASLHNLGVGFLRESVLDSAEIHLEEAGRLARMVGDLVMVGNALGALHFVSVDAGDLLQARERLDAAKELRRRTGDTRGEAADLNSLGLLAWELGDLAGARRDFQSALDLNMRQGRTEIGATNVTNLAALSSVEGDFSRGVALYLEALETYRARDMWPDAADVLWGLGQLEARRGDYPAARAALEEALSIFQRTGPAVSAITVQRELAGVLTAMGEIQAAIDELRAAAEAATVDVPATVRAGVALARADLAVALNDFSLAEREYVAAERLYAEASDAGGQAEARQGQGALLLEREEFVRAEQILMGTASAQSASDNGRGAALTGVLIARARSGRDDQVGARELLRSVAADLDRLGDPIAEAYALGELAKLDAGRGLPLVADSVYGAALDLLEGLAAPGVRWSLLFGRALALRSMGASDAAARGLRLAIQEIERTAETLAIPERRSAYNQDKFEVYAQLALTERMRGRVVAAFEASERLRARESLELLERGRTSAPQGLARDLSEREQDLRARIAELSREAEAPDGILTLRGPARGAETAAASEALTLARDAYAELMLEMRERSPRQADLLLPGAANWRDVARRLGGRAAFVEYLVTDSGSTAFVISRDTLAAVDLGIRRTDLARLVQFARGLLTGPVDVGNTQWQGPLRRLHQYLLAPVESTGLLTGVDRLVIVPHAELHYLPFSALIDDRGEYLVQRYALGVTPSASVWLALGDRASRSSAGVLALAPRPEALPASGREVAAVASLSGGDAQVLRGEAASEGAFRRLASQQRVLHLATYGVLNRHNPLFSYIDLGAGDGHDGRLEVHEVFGLDLAAELVVLSACETALGSGAQADVPRGDDWVGLTRAFLHAGAERVVATLWAVSDAASATLMERFYQERVNGRNDVEALALAQRHLLGTPRTAHPFFWSGVVLVGEQRAADAR